MIKSRTTVTHNFDVGSYRDDVSTWRLVVGLILMILVSPIFMIFRCKIVGHEYIRVSTNYKSSMQRNSMNCQNCKRSYFFWL